MWCAHRFVGAALSTVDMVTDVQVIVEYLNTPGKEAYAYPLMGMVGACLLFQLGLVWLQTRKASKAKTNASRTPSTSFNIGRRHVSITFRAESWL